MDPRPDHEAVPVPSFMEECMRARGLVASALLTTLVAVGTALADPIKAQLPIDEDLAGGRQCGSPLPTATEMSQVAKRLSMMPLSTLAVGGQIKVAWHVIYSGSAGNIPQSQIDAQIAELNKAYSGFYGGANTGYTFVLASVDRTNNKQWYMMTPGSRHETNAKQALSVDVTHRLNIYSCKPGQNLLGWAYFPNSYPENDWHHGVVIHYGSVPGGYLAPYNLGGTADHEVGHYLGLYHTFQGGCTAPGDQVDDTPYEATATSGCPEGKDTCPSAGVDPIHNYMDYSTDACYTQFTAGQDARMDQIVPAYRPNLLNAAVAQRGPAVESSKALPATMSFRVGPNPFKNVTNFAISLPKGGAVSLKVYNVLGQHVATLSDGNLAAGEHTATFQAGRLPAGMYYAVLRANGETFRRSIVLTP